MLTPPSRGFYQTPRGKFCFATLEGATFVPWTHGESPSMILDLLGFS